MAYDLPYGLLAKAAIHFKVNRSTITRHVQQAAKHPDSAIILYVTRHIAQGWTRYGGAGKKRLDK